MWRQISHGIIGHILSPINAREFFFHIAYLCLIDSEGPNNDFSVRSNRQGLPLMNDPDKARQRE